MAVVRYLLLDRWAYDAENLHGSPRGSPPCPYGVGFRLVGVYPGQLGNFPNCAQNPSAVKWWPYFAVLTRIDPDDPGGTPMPTSGIVPRTFTRNLESIRPFLAEIWAV